MANYPDRPSTALPRSVQVAAAWSWRLLLIGAAAWAIFWLIGYLAVVTLPLAVALLLSALFSPMVVWLIRRRVPRWLATTISIVVGLAVLGGLFTLVIITFVNGVPELGAQVQQSVRGLNDWLKDGPLNLTQAQLDQYFDDFVRMLRENQSDITAGALTTAGTAGAIGAGLVLTLFVLIFFLYDGRRIWLRTLNLVPAAVRDNVDLAGRRGFASLVSYVRATLVVAVVDAVGIGVGLAIVEVPLAVPLAALVFLGAFVPIIGAVVTGAVAVLVALVANGFIAALIVLLVVIGVLQLESHVLQPWLLGRAARLHPLSIVLAIAIGVTVGGAAGALIAVPLLAVLSAALRSLRQEDPPPPDPEQVDVISSESADPGHDAR